MRAVGANGWSEWAGGHGMVVPWTDVGYTQIPLAFPGIDVNTGALTSAFGIVTGRFAATSNDDEGTCIIAAIAQAIAGNVYFRRLMTRYPIGSSGTVLGSGSWVQANAYEAAIQVGAQPGVSLPVYGQTGLPIYGWWAPIYQNGSIGEPDPINFSPQIVQSHHISPTGFQYWLHPGVEAQITAYAAPPETGLGSNPNGGNPYPWGTNSNQLGIGLSTTIGQNEFFNEVTTKLPAINQTDGSITDEPAKTNYDFDHKTLTGTEAGWLNIINQIVSANQYVRRLLSQNPLFTGTYLGPTFPLDIAFRPSFTVQLEVQAQAASLAYPPNPLGKVGWFAPQTALGHFPLQRLRFKQQTFHSPYVPLNGVRIWLPEGSNLVARAYMNPTYYDLNTTWLNTGYIGEAAYGYG